jgi:hypothetical protein
LFAANPPPPPLGRFPKHFGLLQPLWRGGGWGGGGGYNNSNILDYYINVSCHRAKLQFLISIKEICFYNQSVFFATNVVNGQLNKILKSKNGF